MDAVKKRNMLIGGFAIASCICMIIGGILDYYSIVSFDNLSVNTLFDSFNTFIVALFVLYTLVFYPKNKYRIAGIVLSIFCVLFSLFYLFFIFVVHFNPTLFIMNFLNSSIEYILKAIILACFIASLYKRFNMALNIFITICFSLFLSIYAFDRFVFTVRFGDWDIIDIGYILLIATVYLMTLMQTPLCGKKEKLGESFMIGFGIVLTVVGLALLGYGNSVNNDVSTQMESFFNTGKTGTGDNFVTFGIIIAVVGVILIVAGIVSNMLKNKPKPEQKQIYNVCNKCNAQIDPGAKFCPQCGAMVNEKIMCPKCNNEMSINSKFCPQCGERIEQHNTAAD